MTASLKPIDRALNINIPEQFNTLYRIILSTLPVTVTSFFYKPVVPFFSLLTVLLIFYSMRPVQKRLSTASIPEIYWCITIPIHVYFLLWAGLLVATGNETQVFRTVGIIFALTATSILPVYLPEKWRTKDPVKPAFKLTYFITSVIVITHQITTLWGYIR